MVRVRTLTFLTAVAMAIAFAVAATWTVAPPGGPTEGVGVHGHWTIDVHDPDGSLAASHEFENAFTGATTLALVLSGERTMNLTSEEVPDWQVVVGTDLCDIGDLVGECTIFQEGTGSSFRFPTLEVIRDAGSIRLQGSFEASNSGVIDKVSTALVLENSVRSFTTKDDFADPIAISEGQFATVTVDLSFLDAPA